MGNKDKIKLPNPMASSQNAQKEAQALIQKLNVFKQQYNSAKGQADGMLNDAFSGVMQNCANLLAGVLQEKQGMIMRNAQLESELQKKIPDPIKKIPDMEKPEPEPKE